MDMHSVELEVRDIMIDGYAQKIALRSYKPVGPVTLGSSPLPVLIYFHGGGFVAGDLSDSDRTAEAFARGVPSWVVSVGYSLAPAHPFPTALEDGYNAVLWARRNAAKRGADGSRMATAGEDAGANIAAGVAAIVRDRDNFGLQAQILISPLLDPSMTRLNNLDAVEFDARECAAHYQAYLPNATHRVHPYVAPIESRRLRGLPAAFIASATSDSHRPEAERFASALHSAGVPAEFIQYKHASHDSLPHDPDTLRDAIGFSLRFLKSAIPNVSLPNFTKE